MTFLAPTMLWAAAAAAIPIALHMLFRGRFRKVPWAAMSFLLASLEQSRRRLKMQEFTLLLLRVAVLVLLALSLARPTSMSRGSSRGGAVDVVLVFDTSYSMAAREGETTRIGLARQAALSLIDRLHEGSTVQVVACSDRARSLGPRLPSDLDGARRIVKSIEVDHLSTDLLPAISEAAEIIGRGRAAEKELYLFGDMQRQGWEKQPIPLIKAIRALNEKATVSLARCGTTTPRNVAIVGIEPSPGLARVGENRGFTVFVRNTGTQPARDVAVTLHIDGRPLERVGAPIASLLPGETRSVGLSTFLDRPGERVVTATAGPDELEPDNRFDRLVAVRDKVRVLVVDGSLARRDRDRPEGFWVMSSLRPAPEPEWGRYIVQPRMVAADEVAPSDLDHKDICILIDVPLEGSGGIAIGRDLGPSSKFLARLVDFVREGHGLIVFGGPNVTPSAYNDVLGDRLGLLPGRIAAVRREKARGPRHIDPTSAPAASFLSAFREEPLDQIAEVEISGSLDLAASDSGSTDGAVILRDDGGGPLVVTKTLGAGEVVLVGASADPSWTDWPVRPTFLPFIHATLNHLLRERAGDRNRTAGESLRWHPPEPVGDTPFVLVRPDGGREPIVLAEPRGEDDRPAVEVPETTRAGVYRIEPAAIEAPARDGAETAGAVFAVVADARESEELDALTDSQIDMRLGFEPIHSSAGHDPGRIARSARPRRDQSSWLLAAAIVAACGEAVLAWFCDRAW